MKKQKNGISLIVLVITIIVIIILAVAVILSIANNNPIENANKAKFQNDLKSIQEELELVKSSNYTENKGESYNNNDGSEISLNNLSAAQKYQGKLVVNEGELKYLASQLSNVEVSWAEELGIKAGGYILSNGRDGVSISSKGVLTTPYWQGQNTREKLGNDIIVPEGVTTIAGPYDETDSEPFRGWTSLKSVKLPSTLIKIDSGAFMMCTSLVSINIPNNVTFIGYNAFLGCKSLTSITIPKSVTSIGKDSDHSPEGGGAFTGCTSLTSIILEKESTLNPSDASDWGIDTTKCTVTKLT